MQANRIKKIIYIILGIIVIAAIGFYLRRALFGPAEKTNRTQKEGIIGKIFGLPTPSDTETDTETDTESNVMISQTEEQETTVKPEDLAEEEFLRLTDFPVVGLTVGADEKKLFFYKKNGGDFISLDFNGFNKETLSEITIVGITKVIWSPQKDRAAVFYIDQDTLKGFIHIGTSSVAVLPKNLKSFSWSPIGNSLTYLISEDDEAQLITANSSARNQRIIFRTPLTDAQITWASPNTIAFNTLPSAVAPGYIFTFSPKTGVFKKIIGPLRGLMSLWSPSGSKVLISHISNGLKPKLELRDANGKSIFEINISTIAKKCIWTSENIIYCAVPSELGNRTVWPDDYLSGEINTSDKLIRIDLENKEYEIVFESRGFDMSELNVSKDDKYLFFVNRKDGSVWRLKLK